ncbi:MAG: hypothetical protein BWY99_02897 [Synergistetes bacterium ADurb.BinA166]|nr:MAG: hypothetical protein BWY99_02897 [Synergistetes bacterium ADurb.BinA166]
MLDGRQLTGTWFDRTAECLARRKGREVGDGEFAEAESVVLTPLPAWAHLGPEVQRERLRELLDLARAEAESLKKETRRKPLGCEAVLRQDPYRAVVGSKRSPAPLVHAASRRVRLAYREAYRLFTLAYRRAADQLRAGLTSVAFPEGCFPPPGPFLRPVVA